MPEGAIFFSTGDMFRNSFLYQREGLGRRRDVSFVDQDLMVLPWYVGQLRRRGTLRLPETMVAVTGEAGTGSGAWLDWNADAGTPRAGRPCVAVKLVDDSYRDRYRLEPMGFWSRVVARRAPVDLERWHREFSGIARQWTLVSMRRRYPPASWEATDAVFYPFACGQLLGLGDLVSILRPEAPRSDTLPALREAAGWRGERAAELLAHRADFLAQMLGDSLVALGARTDSIVGVRAMDHARAALSLDAGNAQALETLASLLARGGERLAELEARQRLVDLTPGDYTRVVAYLRLALEIHRTLDGGADLLQRAEAARDRFVRLLGIAQRLDPRSPFAAVRERWSRPLAEIPDLR
jgi:hypothetical protein